MNDTLIPRLTDIQAQIDHYSDVRNLLLVQRREAIKELAETMTMAEIAAIVGISRARVGSIVNDNKTQKPGSRAKKRPTATRLFSSADQEWDGQV